MRAKLVKESLNEEFLGYFSTLNNIGNKYNIEVYKNPKSIKRFKEDIKGITDDQGNLFFCF